MITSSQSAPVLAFGAFQSSSNAGDCHSHLSLPLRRRLFPGIADSASVVVYALTDGRVCWYSPETSIGGELIAFDSPVATMLYNGDVIVLVTELGALTWMTATGKTQQQTSLMISSAAIGSHRLYLSCADGSVYTIDPQSTATKLNISALVLSSTPSELVSLQSNGIVTSTPFAHDRFAAAPLSTGTFIIIIIIVALTIYVRMPPVQAST